MTSLYNCRHAGDQYRMTKFDEHLNIESSYLCTVEECECPAGVRPMCRHREMLPMFINRHAVDTQEFYDYTRGGWVQMDYEEPEGLDEEGDGYEEPEGIVREAPSPAQPVATVYRRR